MLIRFKNREGNILLIAFGVLIILSFLGVAFVLLARQAEHLAVSGRDRISTTFAAHSGLHYAISRLTVELLKEGQFTKNSKLFFKGEDVNWDFEYNEENDINKNGLVDTFNLPIEIAKDVSIEKSIVTEGDKNLFFRVKIIDESSKFPINDDVKLTTKILENLAKCTGVTIETNNFLNLRTAGKTIDDRKTFLDIFGEKTGNFLLQFFTFTPKLLSKTLYYVDALRYDGEKIYSITQLIPPKEKIKMGMKPFLNINTASKPTLCANFLNLGAFYLKINKERDTGKNNTVLNKNIYDLQPLGVIKYVNLEKNDFEKFYSAFINSTKKKLYRTYKEFLNFIFSVDEMEKVKAELIWVNANPNIDILKFNDIWSYLYIKREIPKYVNREIDKLDLILPTYEVAFNTSGLFSIEVEGRYQYKNIILARHKLSATVDLMDYVIDTAQEDFFAGTFEKAQNLTKNTFTLITYPEYLPQKAKNNNIDGQIGLSFNSENNSNTLCSIKLNDVLTLYSLPDKRFKIKEKFLSNPKKYESVFEIQNSYAITPAGLLIDGIKTLELPTNSCWSKFKASYSELPPDYTLSEKKKEYDAFYTGVSMWIKPSYYNYFNFPVLSAFSDNEEFAFSIFKTKEDVTFRILTKEFNLPLMNAISKKFFGCLADEFQETMFSTNKWFHLSLSISLKSCASYLTYLNNFKDVAITEAEKVSWYLGRCLYYTLYINGKQIDFLTRSSKIKVKSFFDSQDLSEFSKLFIGNSGLTNSYFTVDEINFFDRYELLKNILNATSRGRYYSMDTTFTSRDFRNYEYYLYLLTSEVFTLPVSAEINNMLCIKFKDVTGSTECYGNLIETPYARWNVSFVGNTFNYVIVWKNLSSCGSYTSPIIDSVILTFLKKPEIKFILEDVK